LLAISADARVIRLQKGGGDTGGSLGLNRVVNLRPMSGKVWCRWDLQEGKRDGPNVGRMKKGPTSKITSACGLHKYHG